MLCKSKTRFLVKDKQRGSGNRTTGKPFQIVKVNSCYMGVVLSIKYGELTSILVGYSSKKPLNVGT